MITYYYSLLYTPNTRGSHFIEGNEGNDRHIYTYGRRGYETSKQDIKQYQSSTKGDLFTITLVMRAKNVYIVLNNYTSLNT